MAAVPAILNGPAVFSCGSRCRPGSSLPTPCTSGALCYADCDGSGQLNINDFICFMNNYAAGNPCANCDATTTPPVLNVNPQVLLVPGA